MSTLDAVTPTPTLAGQVPGNGNAARAARMVTAALRAAGYTVGLRGATATAFATGPAHAALSAPLAEVVGGDVPRAGWVQVRRAVARAAMALAVHEVRRVYGTACGPTAAAA